ncbi:hypothetical protein LTR08_001360 [Meristemomyces frigidus]|nr:hypothetical protein LTR08_001360 [Meristemomyces frigidus]
MLKGKFKRKRVQADAKSGAVISEDHPREEVVRKSPRKKPLERTVLPFAPSTRSNMSQIDGANDVLAKNIALAEKSTDYSHSRGYLLTAERKTAWDADAKSRASDTELEAQTIIVKIREHERIDPNLFGNLPGEAVPEAGTRDMGGRFLVNKPNVERSRVFAIAQKMPKGSHLHLHFNSELPAEILLPQARRLEDTMFVRCTRPLLEKPDFAATEIVFNVLPKETPRANIFAADYNSDWKNAANAAWMRWCDFRQHFPSDIPCEVRPGGLDVAESWVREKVMITTELAYNDRQTHNGTWACFNQSTRAFKGLLNYESVYRWYIGNAIDSMIRDKVMYAELRPMLLDKVIPSDDGIRQLDHKDQMNIICEEVQKKRQELEAAGKLDLFPFGVKIIYCTPRSIPKARMQTELQDCIKLKLQFPDLICGFDLVGAEDRPNNVGFYAELLVAFTNTCRELGISIPFMFHAGETLLDTGGSAHPDNSNLYDALLLNAKRIGHGYALFKHPMLVERYKQHNIALELCPISNELLHLCGNAREHPFPGLLAAGLHCTLNADNPSLFRAITLDSSSLSHEFYQVMVGDTRMSVHGWKQLAEWSLEHSCLTAAELKKAKAIFEREWELFCRWVVESYGEYAEGLSELA